jgi:hypothetical protein
LKNLEGQKIGNMSEVKPERQVRATIRAGKEVFENVTAKIFLPQRMVGPLRVVLCPRDHHQLHQLMQSFELALRAEVRGFTKEIEAIIIADRLFCEKGSTSFFSREISESQIETAPETLSIFDLHGKSAIPKGKVEGRFWISPCVPLNPFKTVQYFYTGETKVETVKQLKFVLGNGLPLEFDLVYRHYDEGGNHISFSELVANFKDSDIAGSAENIKHFLPNIDDFLLITSFAARERCACLGWEAWDSSGTITFYRRGISIPTPPIDTNRDNLLVDLRYIEKFLEAVNKWFLTSEPKEYIRLVLYSLISKDGSVETKFTRLFSALETLIRLPRQNSRDSSVLTKGEWQAFREDLEGFIKGHKSFAGDKQKRAFVYEKIGELNRISLASSFAAFCRDINLNSDDLWPLLDSKNIIPLVAIRNRIVHGEPFNQRQLLVLSMATDHLQWLIERALLNVIGWPQTDSNLDSRALSQFTSYVRWRDLSFE